MFVLLMWWFRTIHPENENVPIEAGSSTFEVQLASAPRNSDSLRPTKEPSWAW